jgi:hypothetical protein
MSLGNTILAGNSNTFVRPFSSFSPDGQGTFVSYGYNLVGETNGSRSWGSIGDRLGTAGNPLNPLLGQLANNGGPTPTCALLPGSPALDAGYSFGVTNDQRGLPRPVDLPYIPNAPGGDGSDIGAFEFNPPLLSSRLTTTNTVMVYWPSPSTGFSLQVNTNPPTPIWSTPAETVTDNGTIKFIIVAPATGNRFYRLRSP